MPSDASIHYTYHSLFGSSPHSHHHPLAAYYSRSSSVCSAPYHPTPYYGTLNTIVIYVEAPYNPVISPTTAFSTCNSPVTFLHYITHISYTCIFLLNALFTIAFTSSHYPHLLTAPQHTPPSSTLTFVSIPSFAVNYLQYPQLQHFLTRCTISLQQPMILSTIPLLLLQHIHTPLLPH
jgi:hypothetical protein